MKDVIQQLYILVLTNKVSSLFVEFRFFEYFVPTLHSDIMSDQLHFTRSKYAHFL